MNALHKPPSTTDMLMTPVIAKDVIYSDRYFKFGQCLTGMVFSLPVACLEITTLPISQHKKPIRQTDYMPVFNSLRLKYGIFPGILVSENQNPTTEDEGLDDVQLWHKMLPIIKCIVPNNSIDGDNAMLGSKESVDFGYELSHVESQVTNIVHRDTRNALSRVSLIDKMALKEQAGKYSVNEMSSLSVKPFLKKDVCILVRDEEENNLLLPLLPASFSKTDLEFERLNDHRRVHQALEGHKNFADSRKASTSKSCSSYSLSFSSSKTKSKGRFQMLDMSDDYEILPESDDCETVQSCDISKIKGNEPPRSFMNRNALTVPEEHVSKYGHAQSSTNIQESSFSSIEPYPLPEAPSLLLLEPLLLMQQDIVDGGRTPLPKKRKRRKEQLTRSEQQKVARIMIGYTLAFFLLAIVTFYVVYFV